MNLVRANVGALLIAFPLTSGVAAQSIISPSNIQIENFGQINPAYYRGAQPSGEDYADLAALGIRTIINLTSEDSDENEGEMVKRAGMSYVQIPMTTHKAPTSAQLDQFLALVSDRARQPVYVHCVGGRHRTGVMTAVYRMTQDRWTADRAFKEMKLYKFGADSYTPNSRSLYTGLTPLPTHHPSRPLRRRQKREGSLATRRRGLPDHFSTKT